MSLHQSKAGHGSYRSPSTRNRTTHNLAKSIKAVAFHETSALGDSTSTSYERHNYGNSSLENQNRSCYSLLSSPKKSALSTRETPKDLVKTIINRTSGGIIDEDYPESVDKLLENGFSIVSERKDAKQLLIAQRNALEAQIEKADRDILPERRRGKFLKEALLEACGMGLKYKDDISYVEAEIRKVKSLIASKQAENASKERELEATVLKLRAEVEEVSGDIETRKEEDKRAIVRLEKKLDVTKEQQKGLNGEIAELKTQLGHMRSHSLAKTRMIENKTNTFVGILHHQGL